jgi:hypothetical protein
LFHNHDELNINLEIKCTFPHLFPEETNAGLLWMAIYFDLNDSSCAKPDIIKYRKNSSKVAIFGRCFLAGEVEISGDVVNISTLGRR